MKTVKIILDFLATMVRLFFRSRGKDKPDLSLADSPGHTGRLPPEHRSSAGCRGSHPLPVETLPSSSTPLNVLGWGLIVSAAGGYLLKNLF